jgi:DNA-binding response OmpR family regulator
MPASQRILLIEDDREIQSTLSGVLRGAGYEVLVASNGVDGQRMIEEEQPALVITDMMMPRMGGFPVLDFINTLTKKPAVIMITANEGGRHKAYAEMLGVVDYLRKPFPMESLLDAVSRALPGAAGKVKASTATAVDETNRGNVDEDDDASLGPLRRKTKRKKADD